MLNNVFPKVGCQSMQVSGWAKIITYLFSQLKCYSLHLPVWCKTSHHGTHHILRMGKKHIKDYHVVMSSSYNTSRRTNANTLHRYCLHCITVMHPPPQGQDLISICRYLLTGDTLDNDFMSHPHFGGYQVSVVTFVVCVCVWLSV